MITKRRQLVTGVAGVTGLLTLVFGVPVALALLGGWPLPSSVPSVGELTDALSRQMTYSEMNKVLGLVGWFLWLQFVWCVGVEITAWINRSGRADRVRFALGTQAVARYLVLSAVMLLASVQRHSPSAEVSPAMTPVVVVAEPESPAEVHKDTAHVAEQPKKSVTVKPRDDLWHLAELHLGDPMRWREIFELNRGAPQPNGRSLQRSDLIRPGWTLQMPLDATGLGESIVERPEPPHVDIPTSSTQDAAPSPVAPVVSEAPVVTPSVPASEQPGSESRQNNAPSLSPGILGATLSAVGILGLLTQLRRVQQRRRKPGQIIPKADESLASVETALRIAADASPAERLDAATRALGLCLTEGNHGVPPLLHAVRIGADGIEFLFDGELTAPEGPFTISANGRSWTLANDVHEVRVGAMAELMPAVFPTLIDIGRADDATVLIDLEGALWTTVIGPQCEVSDFLRSVVLELGTNRWADFLDIVVVGDYDGVSLERVQYVSIEEVGPRCGAMAGAVHRGLVDAGIPSTTAGRLVTGDEGWVPTVVVFLDPPDPVVVQSIVESVDNTAAHGLILLTAGEHANADRTIALDGSSLTVTPPGISLERTAMNGDDLDAVQALLKQTTEPPVEEAIAKLTESHEEVVDLRTDRSLVLERAEGDPEVMVRLLGRVEIEGGTGPIDRPKATELVAYLAAHRSGVSDERLRTALWPDKRVSSGSFHTTMSRARSKLGVARRDGTLHLLNADNSIYRLGALVAVDAVLFERHALRAESSGSTEAIAELTSALELVRGMPFAESDKGYQWAYSEGIVGQFESMVANAANRLAELSLDAGDLERVHWAARQGVLASPGWEPLYRIRMLAFDRQGNPRGVQSVMDELADVLEDVEPYDAIHPETVELYKQLNPRSGHVTRRSRASSTSAP